MGDAARSQQTTDALKRDRPSVAQRADGRRSEGPAQVGQSGKGAEVAQPLR